MGLHRQKSILQGVSDGERIYRLFKDSTRVLMWWIRISLSALPYQQINCMPCSKAAKFCRWTRQKTQCYKIKKRMCRHTLRGEPFTPNSIPLTEEMVAVIMWRSSLREHLSVLIVMTIIWLLQPNIKDVWWPCGIFVTPDRLRQKLTINNWCSKWGSLNLPGTKLTYRKSSSSTFLPWPFVPSPKSRISNAERFQKEDEPEEMQK